MKWYAFTAVCFAVIGLMITVGITNAGTASVTVTVTLAECSDSIDNDGDFLTDYPNDTECDSGTDNSENIAGTETHATSTIETSGGSFSFDNADSLAVDFTFQNGFHGSSVRLFVNSYATSSFESSKPAPSGKSFVGKTYDIILYENASPNNSIATTSKAITIVMQYLDSDVSSIDESNVLPYRWSTSTSAWAIISGSSLDTSNNKVTFSTTDFSSFSLLGTNLSEFQCSDGIDNDGDGKIDYPSDPGCSSTTDDNETDPQQAPGGGGGGGATITAPPQVTFSGLAYPGSKVTILKDAQVAAVTIAGPDAKFKAGLSKLSTGNYNFGIWAADTSGRRSVTHTFALSVKPGSSVTVSGIFLPPTISIDKSEVRKGDVLGIAGQSAPEANVSLIVHSHSIVKKVTVDKSGAWFYKLDTTELEYGKHSTQAKSETENDISSLSQLLLFKVGTKNKKAIPLAVVELKGDVNSDEKVNLVDFSIAAYWYKRPSPPSAVDLNDDGKVDLVDFSIMAYWWTG